MACAPYPIAIPIINVTLPNGAVARGAALGVGSPPQQCAFVPDVTINNTYMHAGSNCTDITDVRCITYHGGLYDESMSHTYMAQPNMLAAGGSSGDSVSPAPIWIHDQLMVNPNFTADAFPIAVATGTTGDEPYVAQMRLGLGSNSTILNTLKSAGKIASRTWSVLWGLTGAVMDLQSNGTLVLGGYDAAKVQGDNYTGPLNFDNPSCASGLLVSITSLNMLYPNGTNPSLFQGSQSTALTACIDPAWPGVMNLPLEYYETFEAICQCTDVGRSIGYNFWDMVFDPSQPSYVGDLVIGIGNRIQVTVKNSQLLVPDVTIADDGRFVANASLNTLLINSLQEINGNDIARLGRSFFSSAMIMTNLDRQEFTLWEASAVTTTAQESLVAVGENGEIVDAFCSSQVNNATNGTEPSLPSSTSPTKHSGSSTGAIAGGTVGGVVGLLCIIAGIVFLIRKRRAKPQQQQQQQHVGTEYPGQSGYYDSHHLSMGSGVQATEFETKKKPTMSPEMEQSQVPLELSGSNRLAELPSDRV